MKSYKYLLIIIFSLFSLGALAQANKKTLNYQAVILDPKAIDIPGASIAGQPLSKGNVCLRFSLLNAQGGLDYEETQSLTTDEYGLVNVAIGNGTQGSSNSIYKSFESVAWNSSVKSLKVSVSYDGCNSFKQVSSQALNYTPYALYAEAVDYKNVREAPTKLSQFSNDAGYLIPKDLDPIKADIKSNTSQIATANQTIADNKKSSDAAFLIVNQSITSLDTKVADNTTAIKANTSSITTINTKLTDQQNQINDNRNQISTTNNNLNTQIGGLQGQLNTTNSTVSNLTGTAELVSNKSTSNDLGGVNPSDQLYPSQKAAKAYVDLSISRVATSGVPDATTLAAGKIQLSGDLGGTATSPTVPALANKENSINKSTNVQTDAASDTKYPSVKAVKAYVDQATLGTALAADLANKANIASPAFTGTPTAPTQTSGDNSTKLATTAYVDAQVASGAADATTSSKGIVKLTGDLGGTATSPTVPGLLLKEDASNKSNAALGTSITLFPTQNAVKTYVDSQVASATIVDADATTRGKIQLAGDLAGTATAPTVPGLISKANIASPTFTGTVTSPVYASAPQNLTDGTTISWNPANGLNANVTLGGNRTLIFSSAPASGSYGTLVITQDGIGGRTLTLPSTTNKVLGSTSTTTIALSTAANSKDILNFYFDGSTYFWNVGQGYGTAATITANNIAGGAAGSLPYQTGTGATGFLAKGTDGQILTLASGVPSWSAATAIGVSSVAMTTPSGLSISGSPITSSGTLALSLTSGYAIPTTSSQTNWDAAYTNRITSATSPLSITSNALSLGTVPVGSGGTGATTAAAALTSLGAQATGNLSTDITGDAASITKYPAVKSIKDYVDASVTSGAPDATSVLKGKIALGGDLAGTNSSASAPVISDNAITSGKIANLAVTDAKILDVSGSKLTGTVAVANGGTGATSLTLNNVLLGNGASAMQVVAPGASGNVLTSNGTTWSSSAPQNSANTISGVVPVANGGTGLSSLTNGGAVYASSTSALTTGTLPLTAGGTGVTSQQAAINTLTGTQSSGKYLRSDGIDARLSTIQAADVPTLNQSTTGTAANVTGTVAVANGGTGTTSLTGYVKGSGTSALTASASIPFGDITGTLPITAGGTGAITKTTAFDALSPMTASGDLIYGGASGTGTRLAKGSNGQVLTLASGIPAWSAPTGGSSAHYIGEAYGGGIVFFVWDSGAHGLIVALNEIGSKGPSDFTSTTGMYWGPVLTCGAFRSGYGGGEGNTNVMISKISNSGQQWFVYSQSVSGMYSAMAAQQYNSSYGDWYLPSAAELQLIRTNQSSLTGSGYNSTHVYWSSTETNDSYAYGLALNGTTPWYQKTTLNWILPVRKF